MRLTAPKAGTPSAPRSLVATGAHGKVNLTWSAPEIDGGGGISDYEYRHAEGASVAEDTSWTSAGKNLKETVTGLTNGAAYAFEVRSVNRAGESTAVNATGTPTATACAAPAHGGRQLVWTGNVQVASGSYFYGYDDTHGGSLDDSSLDFGVHSYVVDGAFVWLNGPTSDSLVLSFTRHLPRSLLEQLTFHVCVGEGFALADATRFGPYHYRWDNSGLDWSELLERTLYLSIPGNNPATGQPTITGTATVGQTLTASTSGIADTDGLPSSFAYQWVQVDGSDETDISGATSGTYTLAAADTGKTVKVKVSFTDIFGGEETVTSAAFPSSSTVQQTGSGTQGVEAPTITNSPALSESGADGA